MATARAVKLHKLPVSIIISLVEILKGGFLVVIVKQAVN